MIQQSRPILLLSTCLRIDLLKQLTLTILIIDQFASGRSFRYRSISKLQLTKAI